MVQMGRVGIRLTLILGMAIKIEIKSAPLSITRFRKTRPTRTVGTHWRKNNPLGGQFFQLGMAIQNCTDHHKGDTVPTLLY